MALDQTDLEGSDFVEEQIESIYCVVDSQPWVTDDGVGTQLMAQIMDDYVLAAVAVTGDADLDEVVLGMPAGGVNHVDQCPWHLLHGIRL